MMAKTHLAWSIVTLIGASSAASAAGVPVTPSATIMMMPPVMIGGLLADLDTPGSSLGRRLPWISVPLGALISHRGFSHSLLCTALMLVVMIWAFGAGGSLRLIAFPIALGYLSHLLGDCLTPSGCPLLWPNRKAYRLPLFRTGSLAEHAFLVVLVIGIAVWFAKVGMA